METNTHKTHERQTAARGKGGENLAGKGRQLQGGDFMLDREPMFHD